MIWKHSKIKDIEYTFPYSLAKLILEKEEVFVESGYGMSSLVSAFASEQGIEVLIGKEIIYTTDIFNVLQYFFPIEEWEGPEIKPNEEIEYDPPSDIDKALEKVSELNEQLYTPQTLKKLL